ncbi:Protein CBG06437 [Caenorhabditis briggsae]|uniref:Pre-mRNA-splicing factor 38 n=1 Tax=Caenorhabditis briggsae TaxID=6238 RepID=A8X281_CAEBR|nr:Protein CBG06437 [Caenorhabditis briggsae]CAP26741.2 Protein CBG06437 [Caenorhabditis briggsae]
MDTVQAIIQQQIEAGTFLQSVQQGQQHVQQADAVNYGEEEEYEDEEGTYKGKRSNTLPIWGNQVTMNLNTLVLENIRESYYYKNNLVEIDSFQTLVEQIFYQVKHLEPWEKGTRRLQGMTGMCGGVRGVGAGGVVSSAYCLLYRLFNLRITRKQLISMLNSRQSVYIRGIGFMYIRYTQPPADLWYWLEPYLDDDSEIDPRSGGGI